MNILFVCSGNVSRSFLAEKLMENEIDLQRLENISVASAGLFAYPGNAADPRIVDYLSKQRIPVKKHEARQISKQDVHWADHILVMERDHARLIGEMWPEVKEKVELLGKYAAKGPFEDEIVDPFGRSPYHYRLALGQISLAVKSFINTLISK